MKIEGPGKFSGSCAVPLPVGLVLVLNGNWADIAKHGMPAVPKKMILIMFRRMDESKQPASYTLKLDLQRIEPLPYDVGKQNKSTSPRSDPGHSRRHSNRRGGGNNNNMDARGSDGRIEPHSEPRYSS